MRSGLTKVAAVVEDDPHACAQRLSAAGFVDVEVHDKPKWRRAEREMWQEALAEVDSGPAVRSLQTEARCALDTFDLLRRVFATATAP